MTWRYGDQRWSYIENALLRKCAEAQKQLGNTRQFLECVLTLLKNASELNSEEAEYYTNELLDNVQNMEEEIHRQFSPIFIVSDVVVVDDVASVDKTNITICVDNKLPKVSAQSKRIYAVDHLIYVLDYRLYISTNCP